MDPVTNLNKLGSILLRILTPHYGEDIASQIRDKFLVYCDENGFDWDFIVDEFESEDMSASCFNADTMMEILDALVKEGTSIANDKQNAEKLSNLIFKLDLLNEALKTNACAVFHPLNIDLNIDQNTIESVSKTFRQLCPTIYANENSDTSALAALKAIDIQNGSHGFLLLLWDTWMRYKIDHHHPCMAIGTFWDTKYKYSKYLRSKHSQQKVKRLKYGLQAFNKRLLSNTNLSKLSFIIDDSLSHFVYYTIAISQFVHQVIHYGDNPQQKRNTLPLSFDFWIVPQCVQQQLDPDDADDEADHSDEDHDDMKQNPGNNGRQLRYLGYGGVDEQTKSPIHPIGNVKEHLMHCGYRENVDFVCAPLHDDTFGGGMNINRPREIWMRLYDKMNGKEQETHKRFIFLMDRRNPKYYAHGNDDDMKMNEKRAWDVLYCIKDRCELKQQYIQYPEIFFELSRNMLLPTKSQGQKIGIMNVLSGFMFNLSYHLQSENRAKCYWVRNGEIQRFFKRDIQSIWPKHFVQRNGQYQTFDKDLLDSFKEIKDVEFDTFYRETTVDC